MKYVEFTTKILKFKDNGDKTNWTYIIVKSEIAEQLSPGNKKSFRVRGKLDEMSIEQIALLPAGDGAFMLPVNATMRKRLYKQAGATLKVKIAAEEAPPPMDQEMIQCLRDDPDAWAQFNSLTKSHQRYFNNWVASAKTTHTRDIRIAHTVNAMVRRQDYGQMIRSLKKDK
jgi:uncharacterized protein DUF1905/bacteriocin resistance YdeI/OmpD-like protein